MREYFESLGLDISDPRCGKGFSDLLWEDFEVAMQGQLLWRIRLYIFIYIYIYIFEFIELFVYVFVLLFSDV